MRVTVARGQLPLPLPLPTCCRSRAHPGHQSSRRPVVFKPPRLHPKLKGRAHCIPGTHWDQIGKQLEMGRAGGRPATKLRLPSGGGGPIH